VASSAAAAADGSLNPDSLMRIYFAGPLFTPYERRFID